MQIQSYKDLRVWQVAMELCVTVYDVTRKFPKGETYSVSNQMQRAAVSIPSHIAEGHSRRHITEFLQFFSIAGGSLAELETQILIAERLGYVKEAEGEKLTQLVDSTGRMLTRLQQALQNKTNPVHESEALHLLNREAEGV